MSSDRSRRRLLCGLGAATAAVLAGCSSESDGSDGTPTAGDETDTPTAGDETDTPTGAGTATGGTTAVTGTVSSELSAYLSDAMGFDGTVVDETGGGGPTVLVGAGNGFAFDPAAVRVSTGTTVTWEWTGQGGPHNVVDRDGAFDSGETVLEEGTTYEYTFEERGTYLYYCEPHEMAGMKGAVVVE